MSSACVQVLSPGRQPLQLVVTTPLDIGRESSGLLVDDERVSRQHARLEAAENGGLLIIDLNSSNGVVVNGDRIQGQTILPIGSTAVIGDTRIEVVAEFREPSSVRATLVSDVGRTTAIEQIAIDVGGLDSPTGLVDIAHEPGTLTIAFSDIEKSTEHALAVGDVRWMEIMDHHTELMTRHVRARNGRIVRNLGDGFMMCFRSARQGVLAAIDMQQELDHVASGGTDLAMKVRMGLHTGEVLQDDEGDLFGRHVQVAARIGDIAAGGQILVSGLLKQITEPRGDVTFGPEMLVQLEGLDAPQTMHDVHWQSAPEAS